MPNIGAGAPGMPRGKYNQHPRLARALFKQQLALRELRTELQALVSAEARVAVPYLLQAERLLNTAEAALLGKALPPLDFQPRQEALL